MYNISYSKYKEYLENTEFESNSIGTCRIHTCYYYKDDCWNIHELTNYNSNPFSLGLITV